MSGAALLDALGGASHRLSGAGVAFDLVLAPEGSGWRPDPRASWVDAVLGETAIAIRVSHQPAADAPRWLIELGEFGDYGYCAASRTITLVRPGQSIPAMAQALAGPVLLHALAHDRVFVWHASAVVDAAGALVAVTAASGTGKSSLAAAAQRRGWQRVADDLLPVALDATGALLARPRLWQPKLAADDQYPSDAPDTRPLAALVRLERGHRAGFAPLAGRVLFDLAMTATVGSRAFARPALAVQLRFASEVAEAARTGHLVAGVLTVAERADDVPAALDEALAELDVALAGRARAERAFG